MTSKLFQVTIKYFFAISFVQIPSCGCQHYIQRSYFAPFSNQRFFSVPYPKIDLERLLCLVGYIIQGHCVV